ncbi:MAG: energy transducer TonB [Desulfobacteraceae bacterium]|nr:energy transducer TonB [Desulfobacteraceae bacterium]MBC2719284.1 energy transducer TonB [Desulfobacteraceae bacterium]
MSLLLQKWINDRAKRFGISAGGALLITLGIFWLMQYMIGVDNKDGKVEKSFEITDFVRIKQRGTEVEHKQRAKHRKPPKPEKQPKSPPKPSATRMPGSTKHTIPSQINIQIPNVKLPLSMGSGPVLGDVFIPKEAIGKGMKGGLGLPSAADGSDFMDERELTPLVQIPPFYPPEAKMLGREGMIELEYTVTEKGLVKDVVIVGAKNRKLFGQAAMRAVSKWKYKPLIVDGKPVQVRVKVIIQFELTQ